MEGVLEDVECGHGRVAEAVHEDGLELALEEVQGDQDAGDDLQLGGWAGGIAVDVRAQDVEEERVDEEWAEVFNDEDGAPGDLKTLYRTSAWRPEESLYRGKDIPRSLT